MEESNLPVKRERQEEDNEHDEVRENGQPAVAVETSLFLNFIFFLGFLMGVLRGLCIGILLKVYEHFNCPQVLGSYCRVNIF